jgi:hypothetical protein
MVRDEEQAREYFKETKDILQLFCLCGWMDQFQKHAKDFIQEKIAEAERRERLCSPSWLTMLGSWCCSRGGAGTAA